MRTENKLPYVDLRELHPDGGEFTKKKAHGKRTNHIRQALEADEGWIDVVMVSGKPGESYKNANPVLTRQGRWKISWFDPENGFFRAEAVRFPDKKK